MSTFLGILREYPNLSVDYFRDKALEPNIAAYFLSHCHTDHMHGLNSSAFEKRLKDSGRQNLKLYLSTVSQKLLENDFKYKHLKPYLVPHPVNEPFVVNLSSCSNTDKPNEVLVTLLQAGHCLGSVMFLFEGKNGRVLYTGDFRLNLSDLESTAIFQNDLGEKKKIDNLYIDTTFCKPDAFYIPDRNDSLAAALEIIKPWLSESPNNYVRIICSAQYGYERFFIGLNDSLDYKVHVNDFKFHRYDGLPEVQEVLTLLPHQTRIHACIKKRADSDDDVEDVCGSSKLPCGFTTENEMRILHIRLSAMWYAQYVSIKDVTRQSGDSNFYKVCYSMHSSLEELRDFVTYTQPDTITPNVVPKDVSAAALIRWLRNPLSENQPEPDSVSPPLLGDLKCVRQLNEPKESGDCQSLEKNPPNSQTTVNSSQESKENYESELDLSGCEEVGPVFIKKTPEKNADSPQWCLELTPDRTPSRVPSGLSDVPDCPVESPFKLSLISALSSATDPKSLITETSIKDDFQISRDTVDTSSLKSEVSENDGLKCLSEVCEMEKPIAVAETLVLNENINGKGTIDDFNHKGKIIQFQNCTNSEENDSARGLTDTSESSSLTSGSEESLPGRTKENEIRVNLTEFPSDSFASTSWSDDGAAASGDKRTIDPQVVISPKRRKLLDSDPFLSNYSGNFENKMDGDGKPGSPELFSEDSDESVVECGDSDESSEGTPNAIPVGSRCFEVVDLSSSESRLNGSSDDSNPTTSDEANTGNGARAASPTDSDATPDKIITEKGVILPVDRSFKKQLFPKESMDVEVITLD